MNNSQRHRFNHKRRIRPTGSAENLPELAASVTYAGNPAHKKNPGDFGLIPPALPRDDKTLCDIVNVFSRAVALKLLRRGIEQGLISEQTRGAFPQNVWVIDEDGQPFEAQLDNKTQGTYHGYPLASNDPFRDQVLAYWSSNEHAL